MTQTKKLTKKQLDAKIEIYNGATYDEAYLDLIDSVTAGELTQEDADYILDSAELR